VALISSARSLILPFSLSLVDIATSARAGDPRATASEWSRRQEQQLASGHGPLCLGELAAGLGPWLHRPGELGPSVQRLRCNALCVALSCGRQGSSVPPSGSCTTSSMSPSAAARPPLRHHPRPLGVGSLSPGTLLAVHRPPLHRFTTGLLYASSTSELR
jgi:hypothetical protein